MSKILQKNDQRIYSCYQSRILLILQQFNQVTKSTNQKSSSTKKAEGSIYENFFKSEAEFYRAVGRAMESSMDK